MKNASFGFRHKCRFTFCALLFSQFLLAQCPASPVNLTNQGQVNSFKISYPGCPELPVDLNISGTTILNLDSLDGLTKITGKLAITFNPNLQNLDGLANLELVESFVSIVSNAKLESIAGLAKLHKIKGSLNVDANPKLASLHGLQALTDVDGSLSVSSSSLLTSLAGLDNLQYIGQWASINGNKELLNFQGLNSLIFINGAVNIQVNDKLQNFSGLDELEFIGGSLSVTNNPLLETCAGADKLESVGQDFTIYSNPKLATPGGFPGLKSIGGLTEFSQNGLLEISGFANLTSLGGWLKISQNSKLESISGFNAANQLFNDLSIDYNPALKTITGFNGLAFIHGTLNIGSNNKLEMVGGFENLASCSIDLNFQYNSELTSVGLFPKLTAVNGKLQFIQNPKLTGLNGFAAMTNQPGSLNFSGNSGLKSIAAFDNLVSIGGGLYIHFEGDTLSGFHGLVSCGKGVGISSSQQLKVLAGFEKLTTVGGDFGIKYNASLAEIIGFDSLTTIEGELAILSNSQLTSLHKLGKLGYIHKRLSIQSNGKLTDIDFLSNVGFLGWRIRLESNPKLATCGLPILCETLLNFPDSISIYGNAPGCNDKNDLASACTGTHSYTSGQAWADLNCDSIFNNYDVFLGNRVIHRLDDYPFATTNSAGKFVKLLQPGGPAQSFKMNPLPGFETLPVSFQVKSLVFSDSFPQRDFRICPNGPITNLMLWVHESSSPRPGFSTTYTICVKNLGINPAAGTLIFDMTDPYFKNQIETMTASDNPINTGSVLIWNTDSILPFQSVCFSVTVKWKTSLTIGEWVTIQATVNPIGEADIDFSNNFLHLRRQAIGSYDPNDKTVNQPVVGLQPNTTTVQLDYQIRFQNTGNFPASFIEVIDTLPYLLDSRTIEMLASSHPYSLEFPAQNVLKFHFADINLPDSTSDEPGSHGWLLFRIKTRTGLKPTDTIFNRCGIYFDFNDPVLTNRAKTWFSQEIVSTDEFSASLELAVFPNPTDDFAIVQFVLDKPASIECRLFDYAGRLVETFAVKPFSAGLQAWPVSLRGHPSGVYFLEMKTGSRRAVLRLVRR